ncbi:hypothetical protein [Corynebacterium timonense]|uniref:hypothetical protein n=1 Tax=Corynebacterium timonense TaxID=441500 RepID=UPI0012DC5FE4|nr:hypothetical protein [Corynebacterium timonense]
MVESLSADAVVASVFSVLTVLLAHRLNEYKPPTQRYIASVEKLFEFAKLSSLERLDAYTLDNRKSAYVLRMHRVHVREILERDSFELAKALYKPDRVPIAILALQLACQAALFYICYTTSAGWLKVVCIGLLLFQSYSTGKSINLILRVRKSSKINSAMIEQVLDHKWLTF